MRVGLLLAGCASLLVGTFVACSSFTSNDPVPESDAGGDGTTLDGATPDSAAAIDAALPPTPGKIDCFGTTCNKDMGASCCIDEDAGTTTCGSSCGPARLTISCDEKSDCAPGDFCCVGFFGNTECAKTCTGNGERLCHADDECETGSTCVQLTCRGTVIGVCGPVGNYVKSFCRLK